MTTVAAAFEREIIILETEISIRDQTDQCFLHRPKSNMQSKLPKQNAQTLTDSVQLKFQTDIHINTSYGATGLIEIPFQIVHHQSS